jgi:signal transduction histidine kinase
MSPSTAARLAWSLWAFTLVMLVANLSLALVSGSASDDPFFILTGIVMALGYASVGALIASRHPSNAVGWLLVGVGVGFMLGILPDEYTHFGSTPGNAPLPGTSFAAWANNWVFILGVVQIPFILLLFPTGSLPSPRWRVVAWAIGGGALVATLGFMLEPKVLAPYPGVRVPNPTGVDALEAVAPLMGLVGGIITLVGSLLTPVALFFRYRRAAGEVRQQIRWLAYVALAGMVLLMTTLAFLVTGGENGSEIGDVFFYLFVLSVTAGVPTACAVAILRYRLYDLDVVVKRTVVFSVLAVFVTLVYVAVVYGVGAAVLDAGGEGANALTFVAAALVALAFQPVRNWSRRLADRLVYGKRATPYEVLSEFAGRMGGTYSSEDVLPRMVQLITAGTGATRAEIWLRVGDQLRLEARWPEGTSQNPAGVQVTAERPEDIPDVDEVLPVLHHGQVLGAIALAVTASEPLTPTQRTLLEDLASQAGLVLRNVRLIEELRASRQRLVAAQDGERRKIERDLHDGAQQQLVALAVRLRLLEDVAARDPQKSSQMAAEAREDALQALETLRDLARGIYPPLLADQGLGAALSAQARKSPVPVEIETDGIGRYPQEAEAAVYFCVLEALQNVAKYASASKAAVSLEEAGGELRFTVTDDGVGFDPADVARGSGTQNMADRLAALGGELEVRSRLGTGTIVTGRLPTAAAPASAPSSGTGAT